MMLLVRDRLIFELSEAQTGTTMPVIVKTIETTVEQAPTLPVQINLSANMAEAFFRGALGEHDGLAFR